MRRRVCAPRASADRFTCRLALKLTYRWPRDRGPDQVEAIFRTDVRVTGHAADRAQFIRVDAEVIDVGIVHMEPHNFAGHNASSERSGAEFKDLEELAFHAYVRF